MVPEKYDSDMNLEFQDVFFNLINNNELLIDMAKTKELVFYRLNPGMVVSLVDLPGNKKKFSLLSYLECGCKNIYLFIYLFVSAIHVTTMTMHS